MCVCVYVCVCACVCVYIRLYIFATLAHIQIYIVHMLHYTMSPCISIHALGMHVYDCIFHSPKF